MRVNSWSRAEAERAVAQAFAIWRARSQRPAWRTDYGWVRERYGFEVDRAGEARAAASNRDLITQAHRHADAQQRRGRGR